VAHELLLVFYFVFVFKKRICVPPKNYALKCFSQELTSHISIPNL